MHNILFRESFGGVENLKNLIYQAEENKNVPEQQKECDKFLEEPR